MHVSTVSVADALLRRRDPSAAHSRLSQLSCADTRWQTWRCKWGRPSWTRRSPTASAAGRPIRCPATRRCPPSSTAATALQVALHVVPQPQQRHWHNCAVARFTEIGGVPTRLHPKASTCLDCQLASLFWKLGVHGRYFDQYRDCVTCRAGNGRQPPAPRLRGAAGQAVHSTACDCQQGRQVSCCHPLIPITCPCIPGGYWPGPADCQTLSEPLRLSLNLTWLHACASAAPLHLPRSP